MPIRAVLQGMVGQGEDDGFGGFGWQSWSCRLHCPMGFGGGGATCWLAAGAEMRGLGAQDAPWDLGPRIHFIF